MDLGPCKGPEAHGEVHGLEVAETRPRGRLFRGEALRRGHDALRELAEEHLVLDVQLREAPDHVREVLEMAFKAVRELKRPS